MPAGEGLKDAVRVLAANADFRRLWLASVLSEVGSTLSLVALPLYIVGDTHSFVLAGILTTAGFIGTLVIRIPAGFVADRLPRRPVMMAGAVLGALATASVAGCIVWHPSFQFWLIGVAWAINGFVGASVSTIQSAALRSTLPTADVQKGLAAWQAQYVATTLIGPLLGGVIFTVAHALPFAIDAMSFLLELAVLARIQGTLGGGHNLSVTTHEVFRGLGTVVRSSFLRVYAVTNGLINVASQGMLYGMVFWMAERGGLSVGASFSILAVGSFFGSLLAVHFKSTRYQALLLFKVLAYALTGLLGSLVSSPWPIVVMLAAVALICQPLNIALASHVMVSVPEGLWGRVQGAIFLVGSALYPFGAVITGAIASSWSINASFAFWGLVCGLPLAASLLPSWRLPREGLRLEPLRSLAG